MNETKFYEDIVKSKKPVKIVFVTGFQLIAKIKEFSDTALIAEDIRGKHLIYKRAISTVTVSE